MSIIPASIKEFSFPSYWQKLLEKSDASFDWYGDYHQLRRVLERYLKVSDKILHIGCGSSRFSEELYDNGYRNVQSIDTNEKIIKKHRLNNANKRPELSFECYQSAAQLNLPDESVSVILDRGTIDAILPFDYTGEDLAMINKVFAEVDRCLQPLGRFIIVTLAQVQIIQAVCRYFQPKGLFVITVHRSELFDWDLVMPLFIVVITKLKSAMDTPPDMRYVREFEPKTKFVSDYCSLLTIIYLEQEFNWVHHYVSRSIVDNVSIWLRDSHYNPRYCFTVVDNTKLKSLMTMGVFVVPLDREGEWVYSTDIGRRNLRKITKHDRLIVVRLSSCQSYGSSDDIRNELEHFVIRFQPYGLIDLKVEFHSVQTVDTAERIAFGESAISGCWKVEEVVEHQKTYRRLLFLNCVEVVQSEVEISDGKSRKIISNLLSCPHQRSLVTAINFIGAKDTITGCEILDARQQKFRIAIIGLGGGALSRFIYETFTRAFVVNVEIDEEVLKIAQTYFGLPDQNKRFKVIIQDAGTFLSELSNQSEEEKFDVIIVDLAGPIQTDGLSCPPSRFVAVEALTDMKNCLKSDGVLAMNLVTWDDDKSIQVKQQIKEVFTKIYSVDNCDDVNEVIICPLNMDNSLTFEIDEDAIMSQCTKNTTWLKHHVEELKKLALMP